MSLRAAGRVCGRHRRGEDHTAVILLVLFLLALKVPGVFG